MAQKILTHQRLVAVTAVCIVWLLGGRFQSAYAENQNVVIDMPAYDQTVYNDLISQAELMVGEVINRQFTQNADLSTIQVVAIAHHQGEVIPILTTTVSHTQWQKNPQVSAWTKYSASYALLQRHKQAETVVLNPNRSADRSNFTRAYQIDQAYDSGRLTGEDAQKYLSKLD